MQIGNNLVVHGPLYKLSESNKINMKSKINDAYTL